MYQNPLQKSVKLFDKKEANKSYVIRKKGSNRLYVLFSYCGRRVEKSTGVADTPANRKLVRTWLDDILQQLADGKVCFADVFATASRKELACFAALEKRQRRYRPEDILITDYITNWRRDVLAGYDSRIKQFDYDVILRCWIEPYFKDKTFFDLTRLEVQKFIASLRCKIGPRKGETVSRSRANNIITIIRTIYNDAVDDYHWDALTDPFRNIKRYLPRAAPKRRKIFRYAEWVQVLRFVDPWYRPIFEFMMLTGMIHSEVAGLLRSDISQDSFMVQNSIVRGEASTTLKTQYRIRKLPITHRIRQILDHVLARTESIYVFADSTGKPYICNRRLEIMWKKALEAAGVEHRPFYSIRHSFAAWSLLIGVNPSRLVRLMGHGSKKMIYDVYGDYVDGLESEAREIVNYLGWDFVQVKVRTGGEWLANAVLAGKENALADTVGENPGESRGRKNAYLVEYAR